MIATIIIKISLVSLTLASASSVGLNSTNQRNPIPQDITYYLYTRYSKQEGKVINYNGSLDSFDGSLRTFVIVHGFWESLNESDWMQEMKDSLLALEDSNVIIIDWGILASYPNYFYASRNCQFVGEDFYKLLKYLKNSFGLRPQNIHLIGFSLGAHIAGIVANLFPKIDRITGLEPAAPRFRGKPNERVLDKSDASFVDIVHTGGSESGGIWSGHFSFIRPMGHVDFYPNGGRHQKGCPGGFWKVSNLACSHQRGHNYFIEGLKNRNFTGYKCQDFQTFKNGKCNHEANTLGLYTNRQLKGNFYMLTMKSTPFCAYQVELRFKIGSNAKGSLVLRTYFREEINEYEVISGTIPKDEIYTQIITVPTSGLDSMTYRLSYYDDSWLNSRTLKIQSINGVVFETQQRFCLGSDITLLDKAPRELAAVVEICP